MSCFVTFVLFHERAFAFSATTARVCDSAPTGSESPPSSGGGPGPNGPNAEPGRHTLVVRTAYNMRSEHKSTARATFLHIAGCSRRGAHGRTVSRPQEWDERPTNIIPVLKVFGLRITSLRKYSVRWTCPNLSMSKADTVSQVFSTQK